MIPANYLKLGIEAVKGIGAGVGKIGAAVQQNRANRLATQAGIVQQNFAKKALANTMNATGGSVAQSAINATQANLDSMNAQNQAMAAVTGGTDEMRLAQSAQGANAISDVYTNIGNQAISGYNAALGGVGNTEANILQLRSAQKAAQAASLNKAADNIAKTIKGDNIVEGLTGQSIKPTWKLGWNESISNGNWFYCTDVDNGYYYKSEWKLIKDEYYYFDDNGYAKENSWQLYQNKWYYLDRDCKMAKSKWISWKDEFYYVNEKGEMLTNCFTPDNYWVDADGSWNNKAKGSK
jgi:hypothetical protein